MFADDVSSFSDTFVQLPRQINCLSELFSLVGMKINIDKTKILVFRNKGIVKRNEKCFLDNKQIDVVTLYKYLGLYFSPKSSWGKKHDMLSFQATKAITYILRIRR